MKDKQQEINNGENCPYLCLKDDPSTILSYPSAWNLCGHCTPWATPRHEHQLNFCLTGNYRFCPAFTADPKNFLPEELRHAFRGRRSVSSFLKKYAVIGLIGLPIIIFAILLFASLNPNGRKALASSYDLTPPAIEPTGVSGGATNIIEEEKDTPTIAGQITPTATYEQTSTTPPKPHTLDVPFGTNPKYIIHRVKSGENLEWYAQIYYTTSAAIQAVNYYLPIPIWEGWLVVIPLDITNASDLPAFEAYMVVDQNTTVDDLARQYSIDIELLKSCNGFHDDYRLTPGEWVLLPRIK